MQRIRKFLTFFYIFLTVLVLIIHPVMHKPVALENTDFKISEQISNPKPRVVSDYEVKLKFARDQKRVAKAPDTSIHIKPEDDDRRIRFDVENQSEGSQNISWSGEENYNIRDEDINISGNNSRWGSSNIDLSDQNARYSEQEMRFGELGVSRRDMEIGGEIPNTERKLKSSDEVGNRRFKGTREELVAWNEWRSNLQNRIMDESAIEAPVGTLIIFSFDVSESGHISNLQYNCTNLKYAGRARADMVSVLNRLEGDPILEFPSNTQRRDVRFKGGFLLDYETQYSSPSDYSDYERVSL